MGQHLSYPGNVVTGILNSSIAASGTPTFQVTNWPGSVGSGGLPFVVEVGPGLGDDEKILVTFAAGVATVVTRGWDTTSSVAHSVGEQVKCVWDATSAQDMDDHIYVTTRDDHTQYLTVTRHDTTARHGTASVSHSLIGNLSSDDHTQYLNITRHDAHSHPASAFATGPGVILRTMLGGAAQGLMVGQLVARPGGISGTETSYLLPADGSAVLRATWPLLFAQIGTTYGAGDGSTTFNVPDAQDRVVIGACAGSPGTGRSARVEGSVGGEESHALVTGEAPSHTHTVTDAGHSHTVTDPSHAHSGVHAAGITDGNIAARFTSSSEGTVSAGHTTGITFVSAGSVGTAAASTGVTAGTGHASLSATSTGSGTAHNNMQPFIAVPVFIVAA